MPSDLRHQQTQKNVDVSKLRIVHDRNSTFLGARPVQSRCSINPAVSGPGLGQEGRTLGPSDLGGWL
jgi:hypothetical protein